MEVLLLLPVFQEIVAILRIGMKMALPHTLNLCLLVESGFQKFAALFPSKAVDLVPVVHLKVVVT
jgi:hypothetical protein